MDASNRLYIFYLNKRTSPDLDCRLHKFLEKALSVLPRISWPWMVRGPTDICYAKGCYPNLQYTFLNPECYMKLLDAILKALEVTFKALTLSLRMLDATLKEPEVTFRMASKLFFTILNATFEVIFMVLNLYFRILHATFMELKMILAIFNAPSKELNVTLKSLKLVKLFLRTVNVAIMTPL